MSLKNSLLFFSGSILGIAGSFMKLTNLPGAEFIKGVGVGLVIVLAIDIIPIFLKKKNETVAK